MCIKQNSVLEPLIARSINDWYEVIASRGRYEASKITRLRKIPCIVVDVNGDVENIQRNNLSEGERVKRPIGIYILDKVFFKYQ